MKINPYIHFAGTCEEAFAYYGKVIGAKTTVIMKVGGSPAEEHMPKDWKDKVLHGEVTIDGHVLMATDAPPSFYSKPATIEALLDTVVGRVLDQLGLPNTLQPRWGADESKGGPR